MFLRKFQKFTSWLELDARLQPVAFVKASDKPDARPVMGFFIDEPELLFVAPSVAGPVIGWRDRLIAANAASLLRLEGRGQRRQLVIKSPDAPTVEIAAPESEVVDPNFLDEDDMTDFYVWLVKRLPMEHVQADMTLGSKVEELKSSA